MKITFFSDTHTYHKKVPFTSGDVLVFCGDLTKRGSLKDVQSFCDFMKGLHFTHKIMIAGNHDFCFENNERAEAEAIVRDSGIIYLNDSEVVIEGLKFWGSPIQPWFHDWAFNRHRGAQIKKHWELIPEDCDVLITHGPPQGILDLCHHGERVGCEELLLAVKKIKPRIHAFGHIHEDYGTKEVDGTLFVNACNLDEKYKFKNGAISIEIE